MKSIDAVEILTVNVMVAVQEKQLSSGLLSHYHVENMFFLDFSACDARIVVLIADSAGRICWKNFCPFAPLNNRCILTESHSPSMHTGKVGKT